MIELVETLLMLEKHGTEKQILIFKSRSESDVYINILKGIKENKYSRFI